jgi:hypothetical protein
MRQRDRAGGGVMRGIVKDPTVMTAGQINRELDKLDVKDSDVNRRMIDDGRGYELASETWKKTDPLAMEWRFLRDRRMLLRLEIERRYGPRAPHRLPSGRGFGPIKVRQ